MASKVTLFGPANKGLSCMFTFMNIARIVTEMQGLCSAEGAFQGVLEYSKERLQMLSLAGPFEPDKPADPIIVHPDVRRMLLTAKAFAEGGRMLAYYLSQLNDTVTHNGTTDKAKGTGDIDFYQAKLFTAQFYFSRLLPRTQTHATTMLAGACTLQGLDQEHFRF